MSHLDTFNERLSNRTPVFDLVLGYLDGRPARILEIGVARDLSPAARQSDGWSSMHFGQYIAKHGGHLDSVDISQDSLNNCAAIMGSLQGISHSLHLRDGRDFLKETTEEYDIVLIDGSDDPAEMLACFELAKTRAQFILCDDFHAKGAQVRVAYPNHHLFYWGNHEFEMGMYMGMGAELTFQEMKMEELQR